MQKERTIPGFGGSWIRWIHGRNTVTYRVNFKDVPFLITHNEQWTYSNFNVFVLWNIFHPEDGLYRGDQLQSKYLLATFSTGTPHKSEYVSQSSRRPSDLLCSTESTRRLLSDILQPIMNTVYFGFEIHPGRAYGYIVAIAYRIGRPSNWMFSNSVSSLINLLLILLQQMYTYTSTVPPWCIWGMDSW
jgi:hypothetical protein